MSGKDKGGPRQARPSLKIKTHSLCIVHVVIWRVNMCKTGNLFLLDDLDTIVLTLFERLQCQSVPLGASPPPQGGRYAALNTLRPSRLPCAMRHGGFFGSARSATDAAPKFPMPLGATVRERIPRPLGPISRTCVDRFQAAPHEYAGLGFVFAKKDGFVGVDLDHCVAHETSALMPWARQSSGTSRQLYGVLPQRAPVCTSSSKGASRTRAASRPTFPGAPAGSAFEWYDERPLLHRQWPHFPPAPPTISTCATGS